MFSNHDAESVNTGRENKDVVDDISTPREEEKIVSESGRYDAIKKGIIEIVDKYGTPPNDIMGRETFYMEQLLKKGAIFEKDARFSGTTDMIVKAAEEIAVERSTKGPSKWGREEVA